MPSFFHLHQFLPTQTSSGATTEELESPPSSSSSSLCLPRETFLRIARLSVEVERGFGGARDVEFAVKDGEIHLLQVGKTSVKIKRHCERFRLPCKDFFKKNPALWHSG